VVSFWWGVYCVYLSYFPCSEGIWGFYRGIYLMSTGVYLPRAGRHPPSGGYETAPGGSSSLCWWRCQASAMASWW